MLFFKILLLVIIALSSCKPLKRDVSRSDPQIKQVDDAPIVGYDCNQTEPEILTLSSLEVGACPTLEELKPHSEVVMGQIIQKHSIDTVHIRTCQITKSTSYFKCGANWNNYNVYPPRIGEIIPIKPEICQKIHIFGEYQWDSTRTPLAHIEVNKTYHMSVNEVGWTDRYGYCEGGAYNIEGILHQNVVVQASYILSVRESWGKIDRESGKINIENVAQCKYSSGSCYDAMTGVHTWTPIEQRCPEDKFVQLYKGPVNITKSKEEGVVMITVNRPPFLFAAELGTKTFLCSLSMQMTEFPDVYFLPQMDSQYQGIFEVAQTVDIQFITYLNAKLTFSYHNMMDTAQLFYLKSLQRTCEVERDMLKNRIEIIRLNSQSGGLSSLLESGMFAKVNGEVIHLIKCDPVPVQLRNTEECYDALPILHKNTHMFLLPNTHIITAFASKIPCTPITPITYKIGGRWWSFTGNFQPVAPPTVIHPKGIDKMGFIKIRSFSKGGMYAIDQIEAVQKMISFPNLREAITTDLAAGVTHYYGKPISMDLTSVMSEADWENVAQKHLARFWGWFSYFGNVFSGLIGFYITYKLIKGILTCLLDCKELYGTFGVSLHLFASLWSRLSLYFLSQARNTGSPESVPSSDEVVHSERQETITTEENVPMMSLYPSRLMPSAPFCSQNV